MELLDCMVGLFLIYRGLSLLLSIEAASTYIPTDSVLRFPFLHILATLTAYCLFDNSHSNRCEVISHCDFDLHSPDD